MIIIRNPARARPLSNNVKRLMRESRASPQNPDVVKSGRTLGEKDLAFCDMQGCIFMCAVDRGIDMSLFAPLFMNSQLSALIDFSFFHPGCQGAEVEYLKIPLLLKSPELIVDVLLWIEGIVANKEADETARAALVNALSKETSDAESGEENDHSVIVADDGRLIALEERDSRDIDELTARYEYAYLLGYIYRYESLLHEEASRMVYAVMDEPFMRKTFDQMDLDDVNLADCAGEICQRLDQLIINSL
ncbi:MAG: hypothetical protein IKG66_08625 [Lachnospiraceae bacterium]|nr:hypothetical protein [Lachnospiraceae bacterium]